MRILILVKSFRGPGYLLHASSQALSWRRVHRRPRGAASSPWPPVHHMKRVAYVPPSWAAGLNAPTAGRVPFAALPTPVVPWACPVLSELGVEWWIKRDDCSGIEMSGNKARKLEFLMAEALAGGHDCVVTIGGALRHIGQPNTHPWLPNQPNPNPDPDPDPSVDPASASRRRAVEPLPRHGCRRAAGRARAAPRPRAARPRDRHGGWLWFRVRVT